MLARIGGVAAGRFFSGYAEGMTIYEARYAIEEIGDDTELPRDFLDAVGAWRTLCGEAALPMWSVLHFLEFPPKLLPLAVFAIHDPDVGEFRIRYWGSRRYDVNGADYTGRLVGEVGPAPIGEKLRGEYAEVIRARSPLKMHTFIKSRSQGDIHIYKLRLPFSSDGEMVDGILTFDDPKQMTRRFFLALTGEPPTWARDDEGS